MAEDLLCSALLYGGSLGFGLTCDLDTGRHIVVEGEDRGRGA